MKKLSDCRVLLVDDAKANLDILVEGLKADHKLSLALNGEMALQIAARTPPDLVLLDIMMPGLDGYEVCRRMRQMPETAEVPIMFLSSLEEVQNKTRGFEAGANDYLTKPFDMLEVKARVRSLLKAKAYSDAVKEQIASELRVAREIQMGMLPHDFAQRGTNLRRRASARVLEPAREVGGDLYGVCAAGAGAAGGFPGRRFRQGHSRLDVHGARDQPGAVAGAGNRRAGEDSRAVERRAGRGQSVRHVRDVSVRGVRAEVRPAHAGECRPLPSGDFARRPAAALGGQKSRHGARLRAGTGIRAHRIASCTPAMR